MFSSFCFSYATFNFENNIYYIFCLCSPLSSILSPLRKKNIHKFDERRRSK